MDPNLQFVADAINKRFDRVDAGLAELNGYSRTHGEDLAILRTRVDALERSDRRLIIPSATSTARQRAVTVGGFLAFAYGVGDIIARVYNAVRH